ncbi:hypothetical protein OOK13_39150 [Streptomyces sp. NBC_00378]|uniref:hypothetical protein n=1 Tax=unclassified Streptomyces TaxID=2593676 RepID=UPI00224CFB60|nr:MULTISPECIES: hypothetical protein [unclassified Streptomyces]MCX5114377.1 hypothetical protein [Streptomyces sp. NBC_00378]
MQQLENLKTHGATGLIEAARRGDITLPQQMTDDYTGLEQLADEHADRWGRVDDPKVNKAADELAGRIGAAMAYGNATALIIEHVQPALAKFLDDLRADLKAAGRHATQAGATLDMLEEPEEVRVAILRLNVAFPKYAAIRTCWESLRRGAGTSDPLGLVSPLAEVANLPDLVPDWQSAYYGRAPWPWHSTAFHIRMGWLLANGAQVWVPTAAEQDAAWKRYAPQVKAAA